jgi:hypothetical protein
MDPVAMNIVSQLAPLSKKENLAEMPHPKPKDAYEKVARLATAEYSSLYGKHYHAVYANEDVACQGCVHSKIMLLVRLH